MHVRAGRGLRLSQVLELQEVGLRRGGALGSSLGVSERSRRLSFLYVVTI